MKEHLDELRLSIDSISQMVINLRPPECEEGKTSFELYEVNKSLLLAKAWAGKLQGELGGTSPYKNDGNRQSVADIEPTYAHVDSKDWAEKNSWKELNHVQQVDQLRQTIQIYVEQVGEWWKVLSKEQGYPSREASICRTQIWVHLVEARLHLGFELGRLRDLETK